MTFSASDLPAGLTVDPTSGWITGKLNEPGEHKVTLHAKNALGRADRSFLIEVGDAISLTPAMGWNSWNCWAGSVDQDKVLRSAKAMIASGLNQHGWSYINIDDTWQGARGGKYNAIQPNEKFPDMKGLCDQIHALGLKAGIYSTPWETSYAGHVGGSSETPDGAWSRPRPLAKGEKKPVNRKVLPYAVGKVHWMKADAKQWAEWGFDYLKYDWNPIEAPDVKEMGDALLESGRDAIYSLSNSAPFDGVADWARLSNSWRTNGDIKDDWKRMWSEAYSEEKWQPFAGPGHWNDPDMFEVGWVGGSPAKMHPTHLTADEQYTHVSLWCLLAAPLLIGCDMDRLDAFTIGILSND